MKNLIQTRRRCSSAAILLLFILLTIPFGRTLAQCEQGDTSVYGNHVWNVYAFNAGDSYDNGSAWRENYAGYYVDSSLDFHSTLKWPTWGTPWFAPGYSGCFVNFDYQSWSAKRRGFYCGIYQLDVIGHDDEAQLFVNGVKVWEHGGFGDSHTNVWTGFLDDTSTVVFRVTDGGGDCYGLLNVIPKNSIAVQGVPTACSNHPVELDGGPADSYLWSTGETTPTISVTAPGTYSLNSTTNGCTRSDSYVIAPADTPSLYVPGGFVLCPNAFIGAYVNNYHATSGYSWNLSTVVQFDVSGYQFTDTGNYILTETDEVGCSASSHITITAVPGAEVQFGNGVWKVNTYMSGHSEDIGYSWRPQDYTGYYIDSALNFDSGNKWDEGSNPSTAPNYQGCSGSNDYMSWSAKRQGFPCGLYQIDVSRHDDEAQLFVDGIKVWEQFGATGNPALNVWSGFLNASSQVELKVTEGEGNSNGALNFTALSGSHPFITVTGNQFVCIGQYYTLSSAEAASYLWSNGETTSSIHASQSGDYSVAIADANGCTLASDPVSVTILSAAQPHAHISESSNLICNWDGVTLTSDSTAGNTWSTNETTQSITTVRGGNYTLTVTNAAGCTDQASVSLSRGYTPPAPIAGGPDLVCGNAAVNLTATGLAPGGQVASFNGVDQFVEVTQNIPEYNFTIEMWVKTTAANTGIFSARTENYGVTTDRSFYLDNGQLNVRVFPSLPWNTGFTINDGTWHHIALVVQTGVGQIVYVDGISTGVGDNNGFSNFYWQTSFRIGHATGGSYQDLYMSGQIDNVRIWGAARSQTDIRDNMWLETPASSSNLVYEGLMSGNLTATVGNNGGAPFGISYDTPDYYTYTWTGEGVPAPSTSETQTTSVISTGGTYSVVASLGNSCPPSAGSSVTFGEVTLSLSANPSSVCAGNVSQLDATINVNGTPVSYSWSHAADTIPNISVTPSNTTTYTVTATTPGCTLTATATVSLDSALGDTSVYGDHVWNVYAFNAGGDHDDGHSWNEAYSGYYVDPDLNFITWSRWSDGQSPSWAQGYQGCPVNSDNHSWSAKRKGFACGSYQINVGGHDDEGQLFVNGQKVWEHIGCCDSHMNVWSGFLDDSSTVVFRVTEGVGGSNAELLINFLPTIAPVAFTSICPGSSLQLHGAAGGSYLWNTGETTQTISVTSGGTYSVSIAGNMCSFTDSIHISVLQLDTPQIASTSLCPPYHETAISNYDHHLNYTWNPSNVFVYGGHAYFSAPGNYIFTANYPQGCSASSHITIVFPTGESDFGNSVWQVNAYAVGDVEDYGYSWIPEYYAGFYNDSTLNFDSQNKWDDISNPSAAPGYQGCPSEDNYMSWSAKREGFPGGTYQIDVLRHDDQAQLYIDGVKVWDQIGFTTDSNLNVWTGVLNASSRVEFRVTDGLFSSNGALNFTLLVDSMSYTYYADGDGDNYGNPAVSTSSASITPPSGYVSNSDDCNDSNAAIHPGVTDLCNSIDDNCNGTVDENAIQATITPGGNVIVCKGTPLTLTANTGNGIVYTWYKSAKIIYGATGSNYAVTKNGNYSVHETNSICSSTSVATNVTIATLPLATITYSGSLDLCGSGSVLLIANSGAGFSYQWKKGITNISAATNQNFTVTSKGTYKVQVTNSNGCSKTSAGAKVIKSCKSDLTDEESITATLNIYPNPAHDQFVIEMNLGSEDDGQADIQIFNSLGQQVYSDRAKVSGGRLHEEVNSLSNLPAGNYFVRVIVNENVITGKIIIQ